MIRPDLEAGAPDVAPDRGPADDDVARFRLAALEAAMDGIGVFDAGMNLRHANPALADLYGCDASVELEAHLAGEDAGWTRLFAAEERYRMRDEVLPVVSRSGGWRGRALACRVGGGEFIAELSFTRVPEDGFVIVMRDETERARARDELEQREETFDLLAENSTDVTTLLDGAGRIHYMSPSSHRLMGYDPSELAGRRPCDLVHADDVERVRDTFARALEGASTSVSFRLEAKSGAWIWFETLVRPVHLNGDDRAARVQCSTRDITARKELEAQLEHQALHDPLTGLPNRSLFMDRLQHAPARARRNDQGYGIVYLDLDEFKRVNDRLGHVAGDELLVQVAGRLASAMRESDTLARLSGDEFAIILENVEDPDLAAHVGPRLVELFDAPFELDGAPVACRPSVGIAIDPRGTIEPDALLRTADLAMYAAKRDPTRAWLVREGPGESHDEALQPLLRQAIDDDELALHYQPVADARSNRIVAVEALLRWEHPALGAMAPLEVLAAAQQGGFGDELTRWIVRTALADRRAWMEAGCEPPLLCLNLSDDELASPAVLEILIAMQADQRRGGSVRGGLQLELRSRTLHRNAERLAALRAAGAIIALDDFGADPVSLPLLARAPIDALKIARPLVDTLSTGDGAAAATIVGLAARLGLRVTAEGIETATQARRLQEMGCDELQGFHVGRPCPAPEVPALLHRDSTP